MSILNFLMKERKLIMALAGFRAAVESCPELKADKNMVAIQEYEEEM